MVIESYLNGLHASNLLLIAVLRNYRHNSYRCRYIQLVSFSVKTIVINISPGNTS